MSIFTQTWRNFNVIQFLKFEYLVSCKEYLKNFNCYIFACQCLNCSRKNLQSYIKNNKCIIISVPLKNVIISIICIKTAQIFLLNFFTQKYYNFKPLLRFFLVSFVLPLACTGGELISDKEKIYVNCKKCNVCSRHFK